jgi:hypothetical protein
VAPPSAPWPRAALLGLALALTACKPPTLQQGEASLFEGGPLAFLEEGRATREDVLLRLGTPNAHFEGDRILTYAFWAFSPRGWDRRGRMPTGDGKWPPLAYPSPTDNLVLVFRADGVLARRSLVVAR